MENEKKNDLTHGESHHHKKHQARRKGYFIEPSVKDAQGTQAMTPPPSVIKEERSEQQRNEKKQGSPKKHTPQPNNQQKPPQKREGEPERELRPSNGTEQASNPSETSGSNPRKRRRNRHRSKEKARVSPENATVGTEAPQGNQQKKSRESQGKSEDRGSQKSQRGNRNGNPQHDRKSDRLDRLTERPSQKPLPFSDDEYEEVHFPAEEPLSSVNAQKEDKEENVPMVEVVGIRFKSTGKVYYFAPGGKPVKRGEHAIVETARGQEYGEVAMGNSQVKETDIVPPLRPILRIATEADRLHHEENKAKEEDAFRVCNERILAHGLDMKLIDAQYTFDNTKLLFYFTSAGRVDFRDLVKDLASVFRTRIELRQIGIRDEAKLMGGMGMCGRPLCCTLFLSDFGQVSIKMAKEQNLSLNSAKISGICGRLMCCLRYEHETYEYEIKRTPPVDSVVRTADGNGIVTEMNPLAGTVKVRLLSSPETPPKLYRRDEVTMLQKKKSQ